MDALTPFFVSYAQGDAKSDAAAESFYRHLLENVAALVALPQGADMGFFDLVGSAPEIRWRVELASALGTCQVLIPLLSVRYFQSEWCGKEWHAFSMRKVGKMPGADTSVVPGGIIPVRWAPMPVKLPPAIGKEVQIFQPRDSPTRPDIAERYDQEGLYGLLSRGDEEGFERVVWDLALRVQKIYYSQELKPKVFKSQDLKNIFQAEVP